MTAKAFQIGSVGSHAVCAAASLRDGFRTAQFYARDLTNADRAPSDPGYRPTLMSRLVGKLARLVDRLLGTGADLSVRLILPTWRDLPSPFSPNFLQHVATGIHQNSLVHNPLFNAYFFRAAKRILDHCTEGPYLVLEHRVDAARRALATRPATEQGREALLAAILLELAHQRTIARAGVPVARHAYLEGVDPSIAVPAIACIALLFAEEGNPGGILPEDEFFDVTGALAGPRLPRIAQCVAAADAKGLAGELKALRDYY